MGFVLRPIRPEDDPAVARVIRSVMPEYGARGPGFAINDPEVDAMCAAYPAPRAVYFVLDVDGEVAGGGGVGPLAGGDEGTCELRKMYFLPEARGLGAGKLLLARCIEEGRARGYRRMYLETLTGMDAARRLYEQFAFERLDEPVGATGHFGCDRWYARDL
ncbi:MAG: GNAT family N-acetyltransferase [Polyangiaceae bacterium]|jgi:putative acetyltransferase